MCNLGDRLGGHPIILSEDALLTEAESRGSHPRMTLHIMHRRVNLHGHLASVFSTTWLGNVGQSSNITFMHTGMSEFQATVRITSHGQVPRRLMRMIFP